MRAPSRGSVALLLALASAACALAPTSEPLPTGPLPPGWAATEAGLRGEAQATPLDSGWEIGSGPASIEVELSLADASTTAASLMIGGSHIGFCGRDGRPFLEGWLFGGPTRFLEVPPPEPGLPFRLQLRRDPAGLHLNWNGQELPVLDDPGGPLGSVRLRPHRDTMTVHRFVVAGGRRPPPPLGSSTPVFVAGEDGVHTYRIPSLLVAANGDLLAFAEARHSGRGDAGDIDLVMKRSRDGGRSWSAAVTLWDDGPHTCGNPCPVVDRATGAITLLATRNRGDDHESEIIAQTARESRSVWMLRSDDHGRSWSAPTEITAAVKDPAWTWYATGPGAGIQLEHGPHAGRLVIPCDHIEAGTRDYYSHVIFSDDGGRNWQRGGRTPEHQVNECEVVELEGGRLLLNMRNYDRRQRTRQQAWSEDGGASWHSQTHVPELIEPICQASIRRARWAAGGQPGLLLFSNPASREARERLSLHASFDDGRTWPWRALLDPGPAAYSCLQVLADGTVLCLYEAGPYREIRLHRLAAEELPRAGS